mmetsp:Transcript_11137/g.29830  ORF Transcript_11137/g.29830 Transcript_11137/m.29830 type:complete len:320 (-) Transcript_11137:407-1366(-)
MASAGKRAEGLVFLTPQNMIVEEAVGTRLFDDPPKREPCDITVGDFDDCKFKVQVLPDTLSTITVHVSLGPIGARLNDELYGQEIMNTVYAGMAAEPEQGYDFAVSFDLDNPPNGNPEEVLAKVANLRRHLLGAPFTKAFNGLKDGTGSSLPLMTLDWRPGEAIWIKPADQRCTIVYAVNFPEETDKAICRVMLQQFAKESAKINGAPPCSYNEPDKPPMEVRDLPMDQYTHCCGFLTFVVFPAHISSEAKFDKSVALLSGFRNYLHYHIKASKTYLHMRMRKKVQTWLQVLNRAVHEQDTPQEKKTSSGKTFKRAAAS